jgi:hypothetical protein
MLLGKIWSENGLYHCSQGVFDCSTLCVYLVVHGFIFLQEEDSDGGEADEEERHFSRTSLILVWMSVFFCLWIVVLFVNGQLFPSPTIWFLEGTSFLLLTLGWIIIQASNKEEEVASWEETL